MKDFPDVLPELPGMPPDRDIEFLIELLPGTGTITKRPYRMPAKDLVEIKKQIKELLDRLHPPKFFTLGITSTFSGEEGWIVKDGC